MNSIAVVFSSSTVSGAISVRDGHLVHLRGTPDGSLEGQRFTLPRGGRLDIELAETRCGRGAQATIVRVETADHPFSFFLRDVRSETPIWIPEFGVAVVPAADSRDYEQVARDMADRRLPSDFDRFNNQPEESYAHAAGLNRQQFCPTWLGLGRDMRLFRVGYDQRFGYWGEVQPAYHSKSQTVPSVEGAAYILRFAIGQGASCRPRVTRRLEDGVLPILRSEQAEQDVRYQLTAFATLERQSLDAAAGVRGSEWQACYANTGGNMLSETERDGIAGLLAAEMQQREQEVVCCLRVEALNSGRVPRYAWFRAPRLDYHPWINRQAPGDCEQPGFKDGYCMLNPSGAVYAVNRLDGRPLPQQEMAVLLQPGACATFEMLLPHSFLKPDRARALMAIDVDAHLDACRTYWRTRLDSAARIEVPESPIHEAVQAGLLHCDLATLGREPDGPALATIGWYSPIGTESAPIIQFFDSMGWHQLAERCIQFFFERQRPDGFIQNFARYESETGPVLWTAGEHFRYTRDVAWVRRVLPNIKKAADYLLQWRERNKTDEQRAKGCYGMVDGKVADPDDFHHSFFLNAGTYVGLKRAEEMLREIDPDYARRLAAELPAYREDIRAGFNHAQSRAPLIPIADGSWAPWMPPWVEHNGATVLYADGGNWYSHGAFACRSALTGPLWLVISEVIDAREIGAAFMLKTNQYPVTLDNAALSQPYYCRHDFTHLKRDEVSAFLKTYYNQLTGLHDRETYTFWEHYYTVSQHKTHEEAWFLMQTRWMLWQEDGETLRLLSAVPRRWLENGREIRLSDVKSYFGALSLHVVSDLQRGRITARIELSHDRPPTRVLLRLPHPEQRRAIACKGGDYDPVTETVTISGGDLNPAVEVRF